MKNLRKYFFAQPFLFQTKTASHALNFQVFTAKSRIPLCFEALNKSKF
mgnify:CR=1 FL=1